MQLYKDEERGLGLPEPGQISSPNCSHLDQIKSVEPRTEGCEECLKMKSSWVSLRICLTCGHVGCCDNSLHKHATQHYQETGHPLIQSYEPNEDWIWCFEDQVVIKP